MAGPVLSRGDWVATMPCRPRLGSLADGGPLRFAYYQAPPAEHRAPALEDHLLVVHLTAPGRVERRLEDRRDAGEPGRGTVSVMAAGQRSERRWSARNAAVQLFLPPVFLTDAAADLVAGDPMQVRLADRVGVPDPFVTELACGLVRSVREGRPLEPLALDTATWGLAVNLLRRHAGRRLPGRLQPVPLSFRERVRVSDFIDENLAEELGIRTIAEACALSPGRLVRDFPPTFGCRVDQHVVSARLALARRLLEDTAMPAAEVAAAVGFAGARQLAYHFRRAFGVSPSAFRRDTKC
jgi:AraC family transcriptional regulator